MKLEVMLLPFLHFIIVELKCIKETPPKKEKFLKDIIDDNVLYKI